MSEIAGPVYLDASAWVKFYWPEKESGEINAALLGRRDVLVSNLGLTEVISAVVRRARETSSGSGVALSAQLAMVRNVQSGAFGLVILQPDVHREAERLLLQPRGAGLRAADALHLALALAARAATLASYDLRLRAAAAASGLALYPKVVQ